MRKRFILITLTFLFLALPLAAQTTELIEQETAEKILSTGIMGLSVMALTELLKRLLFKTDPIPKYAGYLCSAIVAIVASAAYLLLAHTFNFTALGGYSVLVWALANGLYKSYPKPS
jgi:hypothetical protein